MTGPRHKGLGNPADSGATWPNRGLASGSCFGDQIRAAGMISFPGIGQYRRTSHGVPRICPYFEAAAFRAETSPILRRLSRIYSCDAGAVLRRAQLNRFPASVIDVVGLTRALHYTDDTIHRHRVLLLA